MQNWIRTNNKNEIEEQISTNDVTYLYFPVLNNTGIVNHGFSTRLGGVSKNEYSSMNLSFSKNDPRENVLENYNRIATALGVESDSFVLSQQSHTTNIKIVTTKDKGCGITKNRDYKDIDGFICNENGITLTTFYADCIPLYFVDPVHKAIGLSHSGWRGTLDEMGRITVERMQSTYASRPEDIIACIGPGICSACYEIGDEVADKFKDSFTAGSIDNILSYPHNGHWQLDLWKANELVLIKAGIKPSNIHVSNICTHCNSDLLYSHRTTGEKRGNLCAFLALK